MAGTIRQHVGRVRERLAERLAEVGIQVDAGDILGTQGGERSCDCARWETLNATKDGEPTHVFSWDTMTICARYGIVLSRDNGPHGWGGYEAHAKGMV